MAATSKPVRKEIKKFESGKRHGETSHHSKQLTKMQDKKMTKKLVKGVVERKMHNKIDRTKAMQMAAKHMKMHGG